MIDTMKLAELLMVMLAINEGEKKVKPLPTRHQTHSYKRNRDD